MPSVRSSRLHPRQRRATKSVRVSGDRCGTAGSSDLRRRRSLEPKPRTGLQCRDERMAEPRDSPRRNPALKIRAVLPSHPARSRWHRYRPRLSAAHPRSESERKRRQRASAPAEGGASPCGSGRGRIRSQSRAGEPRLGVCWYDDGCEVCSQPGVVPANTKTWLCDFRRADQRVDELTGIGLWKIRGVKDGKMVRSHVSLLARFIWLASGAWGNTPPGALMFYCSISLSSASSSPSTARRRAS